MDEVPKTNSVFPYRFGGKRTAMFLVFGLLFAPLSGIAKGEWVEGGARSINNQFPSVKCVSGCPEVIIRHPEYPSHSFCLLCHLEQGYKHMEMRSEWRNVQIPREASDCGKIGFSEDCGNDIAGGE